MLAEAVRPDLPGYSIEQLAVWLGVTISDRHSALGDARATAEIFLKLKSCPIDWQSGGAGERFSIRAAELTRAVGREGETVRQLATDYSEDYGSFEYRWSMSGEVSSSLLRGAYQFATDAPLVGRFSQLPSGGSLTLRGSSTAVRLVEGADGERSPNEIGLAADFDGTGEIVPVGINFPWVGVLSGDFFDGFRADVVVPEGLPDVDELRARIVPIAEGGGSSPLGDIEVDTLRDRLYVSIPSRNEIAVVALDRYQVIERIGVGSAPTNLAMSADRRWLYAALSRGGGVAVLDPDSRQVTRIDTAIELGSGDTGDIAIAGNRLLLSAAPSARNGVPPPAYLAQVDRAAGDAVQRIAAGVTTLAGATPLSVTADGRALYLAQPNPNGVYKLRRLDLAQAGVPVALERDMTDVRNWTGGVASPDGSMFVLHTGEVVRASDLRVRNRIPARVAVAFTPDGSWIGALSIPSTFSVVEASTLAIHRRYVVDCVVRQDSRLVYVPGRDHWVMSSDGSLCVVAPADRLRPPGVPGGPPLPAPIVPQPLSAQATAVIAPGTTGVTALDVDAARGYAYATFDAFPSHEFSVVDLANGAVLRRLPTGGLDYASSIRRNPDGSRVYVTLRGADVNRVVVYDPGTQAFAAPIVYDGALMSTGGGAGVGSASDLLWLAPNALLLADSGSAIEPGYILRVDPVAGTTTRIAGGQPAFFGDARLLRVPGENAAIVAGGADGSTRLMRLDVGPADPVVTLDRRADEYLGTRFAVLSPDGKTVYLSGGAAVDARTFVRIGEIAEGLPVPSPDGSQVHVLDRTAGRLVTFDARTFQRRAEYTITGCGRNVIPGAFVGRNASQIVYAQDNQVCRLTLPP